MNLIILSQELWFCSLSMQVFCSYSQDNIIKQMPSVAALVGAGAGVLPAQLLLHASWEADDASSEQANLGATS